MKIKDEDTNGEKRTYNAIVAVNNEVVLKHDLHSSMIRKWSMNTSFSDVQIQNLHIPFIKH